MKNNYEMVHSLNVEPDFLPSDRSGTGFVCPKCGSGSGPNGTGIVKNPKNPGHWHCWSCGKDFDLVDLYAMANNMSIKDASQIIFRKYGIDFDESGQAVPIQPKPLQTAVDTAVQPTKYRTHVYYNESGSVYGVKKILETMDGHKVSAENSIKWEYKDKQTADPPLYNLLELKRNPIQDVYFVEGEKDADTVKALGYLAISKPSPRNKFPKAWIEPLKGRNIIVLEDNDKSGREQGETACRELFKTAKTIKRVNINDVWEEAPSKGDITDFYEALNKDPQKTRLALNSAVMHAPNYTPLEGFEFYKVSELTDEEKQPPEFIVEGILPVGMTFLAGAPKTKKSFLALQLAEAVGNGTQFLGHKAKKAKVIYFDLEGSKSRIASRTGSMGADLNNVLICNSVPHKLADKEHTLTEDIRTLKHCYPDVKLVIIDTYSRARGTVKGNGMNAYDVDVQFLEPIQRMATEEKIAVLFIHHTRKGGSASGDSFESLSGTMGISGSGDCVMVLQTKDNDRSKNTAELEVTPRDCEGCKIEMTFDKTMCSWRRQAPEYNTLENNLLCKWIIANAPQTLAAQKSISYTEAYNSAYNDIREDSGRIVSNTVKEFRNELFLKYGIGVQTGVKNDKYKGIRIIRIFFPDK